MSYIPPPDYSNKSPRSLNESTLPFPREDAHGYSGGLRGVMQSAWRRRWLVLLLTVAGGVLGLVLSSLQRPLYRATARLEVFVPNGNFLNMADVNPGLASASEDIHLQTQMEILRSNALVRRTLTKLESSQPSEWDAKSKGPDSIARNISIESMRGTRILSVSYDSPNPDFAARFANQLAQEYILQSVETRWDAAQDVGTWLNSQLTNMKLTVEEADRNVQDYAHGAGLLFLAEKDNVAEQRLKHLEDELSRAQAEAIAKRSRVDQISLSQPETLPEVVDNVSLRAYRAELTRSKQELAEAQSLLTPAHYTVKRLKARITELEQQMKDEQVNLLQSVKNDSANAARREDLLRREYQSQAQLVSALATKLAHYNTLKQEAESSRQSYYGLLQRVKEARIASAARASNVRIIDLAEPPTSPSSPKQFLSLAAGLLAGSLLGVGFVNAGQGKRDRLIYPGESQRLLAIPELGAVPAENTGQISMPLGRFKLSGDAAQPVWSGLSGSAPTLVNDLSQAGTAEPSQSDSFFSESIRKVLASILLNDNRVVAPRVLVVSSPLGGDGKTTITSNLGMAMARFGKRVLLIDADARKPELHTLFQTELSPGLADVLKASAGHDQILREAIHKPPVPGLSILPAGSATNFSDLLFTGQLEAVLKRLRTEFDLILIDTPPVLVVADARPLGRIADGVVLVVRSGRTEREDATSAAETFAADGTQVLGTILNNWNAKKTREYTLLIKYQRQRDPRKAT